MKRVEAIKTITEKLSSNRYAIFTTGMISREAFHVNDRDENFYMLGSMGLASSFGLGLALNTKQQVIIFDGDGSALMEMGNMAMIAQSKAANIVHIVLDNEVYQSTGGQPTISGKTALEKIAAACGYKKAFKIQSLPDLKRKIKTILTARGPVFVLIKVNKSGLDKAERINYIPEEIKDRFMTSLKE